MTISCASVPESLSVASVFPLFSSVLGDSITGGPLSGWCQYSQRFDMNAYSRNPAIIGLGTATAVPDYGIGEELGSRRVGAKLFRAAAEKGICYVDTAAAYGGAESLLGEIAGLLNAHKVRVCTKLALSDLSGGMESSLKRLGCAFVDTVLLHSAKRAELVDRSVFGAFSEMGRKKQVTHTGASTYGAEDAIVAAEQPWCDVLQVEHSILNPSVVKTVVPLLRPGQELVVRSVLCKGLLTERRRYLPTSFSRIVAAVERLESVAREWGYTLPELAIRFALDTPGVSVVLVGVSSEGELETALRARDHEPLSAEQMGALERFDCSESDCVHPERWTGTSA